MVSHGFNAYFSGYCDAEYFLYEFCLCVSSVNCQFIPLGKSFYLENFKLRQYICYYCYHYYFAFSPVGSFLWLFLLFLRNTLDLYLFFLY